MAIAVVADQGAHEAELTDTTSELLGGLLGFAQRKQGKAGIARGVAVRDGGQAVIDGA